MGELALILVWPSSSYWFMYALFLFGPPLEAAFGRARFLAVYLVSALGGRATPCRPPNGSGIDWIFGSTPGVGFSGYVRMDGGLVNRVSDHPMVFSDVTLSGEAPFVE